MSVASVMTAGLDDLIPVVIIITVVIARIIKATKQGQGFKPPAPAPRTSGEPVAPGDELREFLKTLGAPPPPQAATPAPPAPPVQVERPLMRATTPPPVAVRPSHRAARPARKFKKPSKPSGVRRDRPPARTQRWSKRAAVAASPKPATTPKQPKPAPFWNQPPPAPRPIVVEACELTPARQELNKHLEDRHSLRGAWLLREVLGPPVALQE
ncbi:MAG: hypothetical protein HN919_11490 [Verrucomicrobia bacterium]|jgi:hypothetical protein|nr:hypothetical protein [Verrucomicrobiota bacterium]MBT7066918.1 hypothetical protein [Verrucomicrobiota bacterium]MBT7699116.1 hypothetical protein [Verrucomicrobiota bacterium]